MSPMNIRTIVTVMVLSLAVIGAHLFPGLDNSRVEGGVRNGLHLLVFAVFAVIVFENSKQKGVVKAALVAIVLVALIGGLSEFVQFLSGRTPDTMDIVRDLSGAALALTARLLWHRASHNDSIGVIGYLLRSLSALLTILIVVPLLFWSSIIGLGKTASPVILDFERWWNKYTYRPINSEIVTPPSRPGALELQLLNWRRSGLIVSPMMTDWSDYKFLTITGVMQRGPASNLTVRINDARRRNIWTDEFIVSMVITPGRSVVRIPLVELMQEQGQPSMDLSNIQEVVIFARDDRKNTAMLLEDIRLE